MHWYLEQYRISYAIKHIWQVQYSTVHRPSWTLDARSSQLCGVDEAAQAY